MQILLTSSTYPPFNSGLGNSVAQQAAYMKSAGHDVLVATGGESRNRYMANGFPVETFAISGAACILNPIRGEVSAYVNFLRQGDWDVVVLNAWQNWATDLALRHLPEISGRKFVYSHCISTNEMYFHQPFRSILRYLAWRPYWWRLSSHVRKLDGVIFLSGKGCDSRFDDLACAKRTNTPTYVVPNSLSPEAVCALDEEPLSFEQRDRLIAVGSYQWQKGFDFVLRAFAASRLRNRISLCFYGQEHTAYLDELRKLADRLGLDSDRVMFHEGVSGEHLQAEYRRARLVLSGSHTECQPLALLNSSASGTPFVARATGNIDGMPWGVTVRDWQGMARQLNDFAEASPRWSALSSAGVSAARSAYHPAVTGEMLMNIVKDTIED